MHLFFVVVVFCYCNIGIPSSGIHGAGLCWLNQFVLYKTFIALVQAEDELP